MIDLSYILGIALLLAAIIYFFAANWPEFGRVTKIVLSVCLMALFYGLSFALARMIKQRRIISDLMLFAGCLSFGVAVALLGQIYNSHADSYLLFFIWFLPACLLGIFTRYQSFYVLSYLLFHLGIWFFLFPSSVFYDYSEEQLLLSFLTVAALNGLLLLIILRGYVDSKPLSILSLLLLHLPFMLLTNSFLFEKYGFILNFVYLPLLFGQIRYVMKREERSYIFVVGFAAFAYALLTYIELSVRYYSEGFFLLAMLFVVATIVGNVYLFKWLARRVKEGREQGSFLWEKLLIGLTTAIGTVVATFSLIGFIALVVGDFPTYFYLFLAVGVFILPAMLLKSVAPTVRYTLLFIGYLLGISSAWDLSVFINLAFVLLIGASWVKIPNHYVRAVAYIAANLHLLLTLFLVEMNIEYTLLSLLIVNASFCGYSRLKEKAPWSQLLYQLSLALLLVFFFAVTFVESKFQVTGYVYNVGFFSLVTWLLYWAVQQGKRYESIVSAVFWFAFLAYKYYDLLWKLLHKSIALGMLGLLFLLLAIYLERKNTKQETNVESDQYRSNEGSSIIWSKLRWISLVILLQFSILGVQIGQSEYILATGETIKLELAPVDPRSLMQGDYVILRYAISSVELEHDLYPHEKLQLILAPTEQGIYEYAGIYKYKGEFNREYHPSPEEVLISARYDGWRGVTFGIESFFVPEGTGREVERKAKYAIVRVGSNGDALLMDISAE